MSGVPVVLHASALTVLVVGGGHVAQRRALALLRAGASVRVVAPRFSEGLREAATSHDRLELLPREYASSDIGDAVLVIAATASREVNQRVTADAIERHRLVNTADAPEEGNCSIAASYATGSLLVGVYAGGVPGAAKRIRDAIGQRFDGRYGAALSTLAALRRRMLDQGEVVSWRRASSELLGEDFCTAVESGQIAERVARWD